MNSPSGLKLIFDAVLKALSPHLHGRQHEAVAHEVRRVAHAFARLEAATDTYMTLKAHLHQLGQAT